MVKLIGHGYLLKNKFYSQQHKSFIMYSHIDTFKKLIDSLNDYNVCLAGICALKSHGLILHRDASDLDMVIYKPNEKQRATLDVLSALQIKQQRFEGMDDDYVRNNQRVYKFKKDGKYLDVILEPTELYLNDCLFYKHGDSYYKVQSIKRNIEAKVAYSSQFNDSSGLRNNYARQKDVQDLIALKNLNFNYDIQEKK